MSRAGRAPETEGTAPPLRGAGGCGVGGVKGTPTGVPVGRGGPIRGVRGPARAGPGGPKTQVADGAGFSHGPWGLFFWRHLLASSPGGCGAVYYVFPSCGEDWPTLVCSHRFGGRKGPVAPLAPPGRFFLWKESLISVLHQCATDIDSLPPSPPRPPDVARTSTIICARSLSPNVLPPPCCTSLPNPKSPPPGRRGSRKRSKRTKARGGDDECGPTTSAGSKGRLQVAQSNPHDQSPFKNRETRQGGESGLSAEKWWKRSPPR